MRRLILIAVLCIFGSTIAGQPSSKVRQAGTTTVIAHWQEERLEVVVTSAPGRGTDCYSEQGQCFSIKKIEMKVSGRKLFIPKSIYSGLFNVSSIRLEPGKILSTLSMEGGDASEGYIVKIEFDRSRIKKKSLYSALSESEPLEVIKYFDVTLEN